MEKRKQADSAINTLIKANENLKGKQGLSGAEIKKLSKTLRKTVYRIFLTIGIAEDALRGCYRATAQNIKDKSSRI